MENEIQKGSRVLHKNGMINGVLDMPVVKTENKMALCIHLDAEKNEFVEDWFEFAQLELYKNSRNIK